MTSPDLLRRFTPTPWAANLPVMGRTIHLETNRPLLLERTQQAFEDYGQSRSPSPEFTWRLVGEADSHGPPWSELVAFSDDGLSFVDLGRGGFLAVDSESREAVGFLSDELIEDKMGFSRCVLATLFSLSAPAVGLIPFSAVCIGREAKGFLVFGPARNSGAISGRATAELRSPFHGDPVVFLEHDDRGVRAWSEFWPAGPDEELPESPPQLRMITRALRSAGCSSLDQQDDRSHNMWAAVIPVASVFLESRPAAAPRLAPLGSGELVARLQERYLLEEDERSQPERATMGATLAGLPAYRLNYGNDLQDAATFIRSLLNSRDLWELRS